MQEKSKWEKQTIKTCAEKNNKRNTQASKQTSKQAERQANNQTQAIKQTHMDKKHTQENKI